MSLFGFLDKLMGVLPIQGRVERWRNQLTKAEKRKEYLLDQKWSDKNAKEINSLDVRIDKLNSLLANRK